MAVIGIQVNMKIKSITDVITNSSSEAFTFKRLPGDTRTFEEIKQAILEYHDAHMKDFRDRTSEEKIDCYSGDVQDIELTTTENKYIDYKQHWVDKKRREEFTKEMYNILRGYPDNEADEYIHIDLDEGFEATIDCLVENFWVLEVATCYWLHDDEGRYVRKGTWEEYQEQRKADREDED